MAGDRYVALGLASVRSPWFTEVARWSTAGSLPLEFMKCVTAEEIRARLGAGRPFSAMLIDGTLAAFDRDLVDAASAAGAVTLVVGDDRARDWASLGVAAVLPPGFGRADLLSALQQHAALIGDAGLLPGDAVPAATVGGWRGRLVAVTGSGGVGTSTVAMALAQGLAGDPRYAGMTALADFALDADLALLHDARDVVPGVQELVEAHRSGRPSGGDIRALTYEIANRQYHLVLGLRRHRDWTSIRPRAFEAAVDSLLRSFRVVVADIDADLEGEAECGSYDVEERNVMARTVAERSDVVVVVGAPGIKGLRDLVRTVDGLRAHGVAGNRILAVVNRAGRNARVRAELSRTFAALTASSDHGGGSGRPIGDGSVVGPIFLPDRRGIDDMHRDGVRLPTAIASPLVGAVRAILERNARVAGRDPEPVAVAPGTLGRWAEEPEGRP